ncbi:MAG: class I SAM-dependent DNA methyltransferase [Carbonactinosporaceae bacterium]
MTDTQPLRAFYLQNGEGEPSIFHIWEHGGAKGDSVTPSTYSDSYRNWMEELLRKFLDENEGSSLLSVGCGNAAIEASLVADGYRVLGVDALEEAVALARHKGVDATCADVRTWTPPPGSWRLLYADGLFGHLHDPGDGLQPVLRRFRSWLPENGGLVISNDGPRTASDIEPHPDVPGFVWLSGSYLQQQVEQAGFQDVSCALFTYERPVSGPRERVIITARA